MRLLEPHFFPSEISFEPRCHSFHLVKKNKLDAVGLVRLAGKENRLSLKGSNNHICQNFTSTSRVVGKKSKDDPYGEEDLSINDEWVTADGLGCSVGSTGRVCEWKVDRDGKIGYGRRQRIVQRAVFQIKNDGKK